MVLEFKIGTFTARTTVGSQTVTGVGFTPKAVLLFSTGNTAFDTFSGDIQYYPGFAASAVEQRSYAILGFDNSATSDTDSGYNIICEKGGIGCNVDHLYVKIRNLEKQLVDMAESVDAHG